MKQCSWTDAAAVLLTVSAALAVLAGFLGAQRIHPVADAAIAGLFWVYVLGVPILVGTGLRVGSSGVLPRALLGLWCAVAIAMVYVAGDWSALDRSLDAAKTRELPAAGER